MSKDIPFGPNSVSEFKVGVEHMGALKKIRGLWVQTGFLTE